MMLGSWDDDDGGSGGEGNGVWSEEEDVSSRAHRGSRSRINDDEEHPTARRLRMMANGEIDYTAPPRIPQEIYGYDDCTSVSSLSTPLPHSSLYPSLSVASVVGSSLLSQAATPFDDSTPATSSPATTALIASEREDDDEGITQICGPLQQQTYPAAPRGLTKVHKQKAEVGVHGLELKEFKDHQTTTTLAIATLASKIGDEGRAPTGLQQMETDMLQQKLVSGMISSRTENIVRGPGIKTKVNHVSGHHGKDVLMKEQQEMGENVEELKGTTMQEPLPRIDERSIIMDREAQEYNVVDLLQEKAKVCEGSLSEEEDQRMGTELQQFERSLSQKPQFGERISSSAAIDQGGIEQELEESFQQNSPFRIVQSDDADDAEAAQPGAFSFVPISDNNDNNHREETDSLDSDSTLEEEDEIMLERLVQARPVDIPDLPLAEAVIATEDPQRPSKRNRHTILLVQLGCVILILMLGVGLLGGYIFHAKGRTEDVHQFLRTQVPTSAPTTLAATPDGDAVLDALMNNLPNYTLESLRDPLSAQSRALAWLQNHDEVTNLKEWRKQQLFALACVFYALDGPNWANHIQSDWMDDSRHECFWFSGRAVTFSTKDQSYLHFHDSPCNDVGQFEYLMLRDLELSESELQPIIPPEIELLSRLTKLSVLFSGFSGALQDIVPSQLFRMPALTIFDMSGNLLRGTIPTEFGRLSKLVTFGCFNNDLSGPIPSEFGELRSLETLFVNDNRLSGLLTTEFSYLTSLTLLSAGNNHLSGPVFNYVGGMTRLKLLQLNDNKFSGDIGNHLPATLERVEVQGNHLSGALDSSLGLLTNLKVLDISNNQLSATIPSELGSLMDLYRLDLSGNADLTGEIPQELGSLASKFNLSDVNITGCPGLVGTLSDDLCLLQNKHCDYKLYHWMAQADPCRLAFDCSTQLCGCHCNCSL